MSKIFPEFKDTLINLSFWKSLASLYRYILEEIKEDPAPLVWGKLSLLQIPERVWAQTLHQQIPYQGVKEIRPRSIEVTQKCRSINNWDQAPFKWGQHTPSSISADADIRGASALHNRMPDSHQQLVSKLKSIDSLYKDRMKVVKIE